MKDRTVQSKIDCVLDRVKDIQSGLTASQLGLVQKIRYNHKERKLVVFFNPTGRSKICCSVLNMAVMKTMETEMEKAFKEAFPGVSVQFADAAGSG